MEILITVCLAVLAGVFIVKFCIKDESKKTEKDSETSYYDVEITEKHKDEKEEVKETEVKETEVPVKTGIIYGTKSTPDFTSVQSMPQTTKEVKVIYRHIPVASTHELGYGKKSSCYPSGMAGSFGELTSWWGDEQCPGQISDSSKRLILFTPYEKEWSVVTENWNNVIHYPSVAGNGLGELDYKEIIDAIGNSI